MSIIHLPRHWSLAPSEGESQYAMIAKLSSVCWLEITAHFNHVIPGSYDVIWRVEMPTESSANFHCEWTAIPYIEDKPVENVPQVRFSQKQDAEWSQALVEKGWCEITIGRLVIPDGLAVLPRVSVKMFGGNSYWFHDLKVDFAELRPVHPNSPLAEEYPVIRLDSDKFASQAELKQP